MSTDARHAISDPEHSIDEILSAIVDSVRLPVPHWSMWVLPPDDPEIMLWVNSYERGRTNEFSWWAADYELFVRERGWDGLQSVRDKAAQTPFASILDVHLSKLLPRELFQLQWMYATTPSSQLLDNDQILVWDLQSAIYRIPQGIGMGTSLLPQSLSWLHNGTQQSRLLIPKDCFRIPALWFEDYGISFTPLRRPPTTRTRAPSGAFTWRQLAFPRL